MSEEIKSNEENINQTLNDPTYTGKKKRGRKPKNQLTQQDKTEDKNINEFTIKKRGRKANSKLINLEQSSDVEIMSDLIVAHLPLKMDDMLKVIMETNKVQMDQPEKCDIIKNNDNTNKNISKCVDLSDDSNEHKLRVLPCQKCACHENKINELINEITKLKKGIVHCTTTFDKKIFETKINFYNKNENVWADKTDVACWWCCHTFDNIPLGIPEHIIKNNYHMYGCFCSFNCTLAYILDINDSKIWDRMANMYQLKNAFDEILNNGLNNSKIMPAPPRQTLKMFGGHLSINEYRESFYIINREYRFILPPMVSIIGLIEEDNKDLTNSNKINFGNHQRIKRTKPLPKQSNNLNSIVNKIQTN
jgi:hypothetical protein